MIRAPMLRQPGPRHPVRVDYRLSRVRSRAYRPTSSATSLTEALWSQLDGENAEAAVVWIGDGTLGDVDYVIPAVSADGARAVTFSEPRHDAGPARLVSACATLGFKDGVRFVHCHGIWRRRDGVVHGGHLLPDRNGLIDQARGLVHSLEGVRIEALPDAETNFPLLQPTTRGAIPMIDAAELDATGMFVRIRPNEDLVETVEKLCLAEGLAHAVIRASLGSLVGACLEHADGSEEWVDGPVVEVVSMVGHVAPDEHGTPRASIGGVVVGTDGRLHAGRFAPGRNLVAVTFELVLERWT
jgi:predicted DNA-binding protein with PD1-like motif